MGENLTTRGIDIRDIRIGDQIRAGGAMLEITKPRGPCTRARCVWRIAEAGHLRPAGEARDPASPRWGMSGFYAQRARAGAGAGGRPDRGRWASWPDGMRRRSASNSCCARRRTRTRRGISAPPAAGIARRVRPHRQLAAALRVRGATCSLTASSSRNPCCAIPERLLHVANSGTFYRALSVEEYRELLRSFLGEASLRRWIRALPPAAAAAHPAARRARRGDAGRSHAGALESRRRDPGRGVPARFARSWSARHGEPRLEDGGPAASSVISLGKLGGRELNYSSDIDLMFVYAGNGETDGPAPLTNKEFYKKVANEYTALLSTYTAEGQCYRVDLRLRPDGTLRRGLHLRGGRARLLQRSARAIGRSRC